MEASKSQEQNYKKLILPDFTMVEINALLGRLLHIQIHIASLQYYINLQDSNLHRHLILHRPHLSKLRTNSLLTISKLHHRAFHLYSKFRTVESEYETARVQQVANFAALHSQLDIISSKFIALHDCTNHRAITVAYQSCPLFKHPPRTYRPRFHRQHRPEICHLFSQSGETLFPIQPQMMLISISTLILWMLRTQDRRMTPHLRFLPAPVSECSRRLHRALARYFNRAPASASPRRLRLFHRAPDLSQRLRCAPPRSFYRAPASASPRRLRLLRARASVSTRLYHRAQVSAYPDATPMAGLAYASVYAFSTAATDCNYDFAADSPDNHISPFTSSSTASPAPLASTPFFARMLLSASTRTTCTVTSTVTHRPPLASTTHRVDSKRCLTFVFHSSFHNAIAQPPTTRTDVGSHAHWRHH